MNTMNGVQRIQLRQLAKAVADDKTPLDSCYSQGTVQILKGLADLSDEAWSAMLSLPTLASPAPAQGYAEGLEAAARDCESAGYHASAAAIRALSPAPEQEGLSNLPPDQMAAHSGQVVPPIAPQDGWENCPVEVFCGHEVYTTLSEADQKRIGTEGVAAVLDALAYLIRHNSEQAATQGNK